MQVMIRLNTHSSDYYMVLASVFEILAFIQFFKSVFRYTYKTI